MAAALTGSTALRLMDFGWLGQPVALEQGASGIGGWLRLAVVLMSLPVVAPRGDQKVIQPQVTQPHDGPN